MKFVCDHAKVCGEYAKFCSIGLPHEWNKHRDGITKCSDGPHHCNREQGTVKCIPVEDKKEA